MATFWCLYLEPIGSSPPKLNTKKINVITEDLETKLALTCPAQGMPIPSYRWEIKEGGEGTVLPIPVFREIRE